MWKRNREESYFRSENIVLVVDDNPAEPPAGHQEPLGEAPAGQDGHGGGEAGDGDVVLPGKHAVLVDLVSDDRELEQKTKSLVISWGQHLSWNLWYT